MQHVGFHVGCIPEPKHGPSLTWEVLDAGKNGGAAMEKLVRRKLKVELMTSRYLLSLFLEACS